MKKEFIYTELLVQLSLTIIKPIIFVIAFSPFILSIVFQKKLSNLLFFICTSLSLLLFPVLTVLLIALIFKLLPNVPNGKHNFFTKHYYIWLFKDLIHETVVTSSFLNNLVIRIKPIRYLFYSIIGMPNKNLIILANDVRILDPDRVHIGKFTFIGINTILSGHIIRSGRLVLEKIHIGNSNILGAFCSVACGVKTGNDCKIDSFVTINNNVTIGNNSVILGKTFIDSYVKIGNNVRVGKSCIIGSNTIIEDKAIIGDYLRIGNNKIIKKGEIIKTDML